MKASSSAEEFITSLTSESEARISIGSGLRSAAALQRARDDVAASFLAAARTTKKYASG
jgi:hypothetical protein